jgi:hypothetical protein
MKMKHPCALLHDETGAEHDLLGIVHDVRTIHTTRLFPISTHTVVNIHHVTAVTRITGGPKTGKLLTQTV